MSFGGEKSLGSPLPSGSFSKSSVLLFFKHIFKLLSFSLISLTSKSYDKVAFAADVAAARPPTAKIKP